MNEENKVNVNTIERENPIIVKESMVPIKSPEVTIREEIEEDGKYMLFNAENELILVINATGKFILENCDGEKTIAQLVKTIESNYTIQEDICLTEVVKGYIGTLLSAKLVKIKEEEKQ